MKHEKLLEIRDKTVTDGVPLAPNGELPVDPDTGLVLGPGSGLDDDDFSIVTTDSDRLYASTVVNRVMKQKYFQISQQRTVNQKRESDKLKAADRLKQQKRVGKQIDVNWLQRKQQLVPTATDLKVFESKEPLVTLHMNHSPDFAANQAVRSVLLKQNSDAFRVQGCVDTDSSPSYKMTLNNDDIFGSLLDEMSMTNTNGGGRSGRGGNKRGVYGHANNNNNNNNSVEARYSNHPLFR